MAADKCQRCTTVRQPPSPVAAIRAIALIMAAWYSMIRKTKPSPVVQAVGVQQRPDAGTLHCRRRSARTEIQQTAGHQGQVFDAWPWCGQVPVQQAHRATVPEDDVARGDVTVADNLAAFGQRCSGRQVMQPPNQGHHRLKRRALTHPHSG